MDGAEATDSRLLANVLNLSQNDRPILPSFGV